MWDSIFFKKETELKVNKTDREDINIILMECFADEAVFGVECDETNIESSFQDSQDFGGAWVSVRRVLAVWRVVDTDQ